VPGHQVKKPLPEMVGAFLLGPFPSGKSDEQCSWDSSAFFYPGGLAFSRVQIVVNPTPMFAFDT
ncbi:MAG: hypothetical protein NWS01_10830, partial [Burkholderiales bacterium]|nr:hypothetical protein [Burkholderiales bacterium]